MTDSTPPPGILARIDQHNARVAEQRARAAAAERLHGHDVLMGWYEQLRPASGAGLLQAFAATDGLDRLIGTVQSSPHVPGAPVTSTYLPNRVDLDIYRGDDIDLRLVVTNQDGTPADLTVDTNVRAQIRAAPDDPEVLGSFIPTIDVTAPDIIRLKLPRTVTANLPPLCVWDCEVQQGKAAIPPVLVAGSPAGGTPGNGLITISVAVPAAEWLFMATSSASPIVGFMTDSAGNTYQVYYPQGFNPTGDGSVITFWQCQVENSITPGVTLNIGPSQLARLVWVPGCQGGIAGFSGVFATASAITQLTAGPIGSPGQMIISLVRTHAGLGIPQWQPQSLTAQLGQVTTHLTHGSMLAGVNLPSIEAASPSATWTVPGTVPMAKSVTAFAFDVALPWTTTVVAGTITTTPDVTRY